MNDLPHRIRLPKPWNVVTSYGTAPHDADVQVTMHEFQRNFQCPSGLNANSRLELEIQPHENGLQQLACFLNGLALDNGTSESGVWRMPIQPNMLQPVNRLTVHLTYPGQQPEAILPQVALVIR